MTAQNTGGSTPGIPALLRVLNDRATLDLLLAGGPMSRNEIAQSTGLSKPTASEIIRRLEAAGLIAEAGEREGRRGPNAVLYRVIGERFLSVAVDIRFPDIVSTVVDVTGRAYPTARHPQSGVERDADAVAMVRTAVQRACAAAGVHEDDIVMVCVGLQAAVDHRADSLTFVDEMPGWPRHGVAAMLAAALGTRVVLENDANLAAVAERVGGAGADAESFALLWLAEGLGLALDLGGTVHTGHAGAAGEIGYLGAPAEAAALGGERLGDLVSDDAVLALAERFGLDATDSETALRSLAGLPPEHPLVAALAERVATSVVPALAVADPERVVLHGPTGIAGGDALATATARWLRDHTRWVTEVVAPGVTVEPVLAGARSTLRTLVADLLAERVGTLPDDTAPASAPHTRSLDTTGML